METKNIGQFPPTSFVDYNGYNVCVGSSYYPVSKQTLNIYEPFTAHEKTREQLSEGCFYFSSMTDANDFIRERQQLDKEFSRYKQDCRKRALELAQNTARNLSEWVEANNVRVFDGVEDGKDVKAISKQTLVASELLTPLADKYYKWLISIPQ